MYFAYTQRTGISNPAGGACLASFWGLDEEVLWWGIGTFDGNLPGRRLTFPYSSGIQILQLGR